MKLASKILHQLIARKLVDGGEAVGANEILLDEVLYFGKITNGNVIVDDKNGGDHGNAGIFSQINYANAFVEMVKNTSIKN